ncbi:MAG TPA: LuxR family transcriptional regulator [Acidimicrobiales bacterium]
MLLDRVEERKRLDGLLDAARQGLSGALVLRGEPGVGKTALLEYAVQSAPSMRMARVAGVESETSLGFAALHQLLVPFMAGVELLPPPQRQALGVAFGLVTGEAPDPFLVDLAVLTLLADAAVEQPLLVILDDAQWLDQESADVFGFVARRLYADRIVLLCAVRETIERDAPLPGLPDVHVGGLPDGEAHQLLSSVVRGSLDEGVGARIVAETGGNPLALLELPGELTPDQLAGWSPLPEPLPLGSPLEERFLRVLSTLPGETQTLLLLAAAEPSAAPVRLWRAAERLGIRQDAVAPAQAERLVGFGPPITFRHPLIRSAVYHGASVPERQRVHQALAETCDPELHPDRRAWHRASAAIAPDESVAAELEASADRARVRGGYAATAAFLERAAQLSPDERHQEDRLLAAAEAELTGGAPLRAQGLLDQVTPRPIDKRRRSHATRLKGAIRYALGQLEEAPSLLLRAARGLESFDLRLARDTMLEAMQAALYAGRLAVDVDLHDIARAALEMPTLPKAPPTVADLLLDGYATLLTSGHPAAVPVLREAVAALRADGLRIEDGLRWMMLGCLAAGELWDDEAQTALADRWVDIARDRGALTTLPVALNYQGWYRVQAGQLAAAEVCSAEENEIAAATGNTGVVGSPGAGPLLCQVWRGQEAQARSTAEAITSESTDRGQGAGITHSLSAITLLDIGLAHYDAALVGAQDVFDEDLIYLGTLTLPDMVEAAARTDDRAAAWRGLGRLSERARASGSSWAVGVLARSRALVSNDADAEGLFSEAIDHLGHTTAAPDLARAHLVYGEWLRRQRRRRDAREQLRMAYDAFDSIGAESFAERARIELLATGERARKRSVDTRYELTAQEAQIARLASEGTSNPAIAARLFISPSTVEYHLKKVFRKLDVGSRLQLAPALLGQGQARQPAVTNP